MRVSIAQSLAGSRTLRFGVGPSLHLARPLEKAPQVTALAPHEFPKFQKADLRHLHAGIGLNAPQQIGAPPRRQPMALSGIPKKANLVAHAAIIPARSNGHSGRENHEPRRARRIPKDLIAGISLVILRALRGKDLEPRIMK